MIEEQSVYYVDKKNTLINKNNSDKQLRIQFEDSNVENKKAEPIKGNQNIFRKTSFDINDREGQSINLTREGSETIHPQYTFKFLNRENDTDIQMVKDLLHVDVKTIYNKSTDGKNSNKSQESN